jgi:signal transduction histidine kinase
MGFAKPSKARATRTEVKQILDEAVELAEQKTKSENLDVQMEIAEGIQNVFVDSAQVASAIANVISNAVESYGETNGVVKIIAETAEADNSIQIQISDNGCGMDSETVKNAILPFFSKKEAGRKRGMGLAYAVRFIQLNKGSLNIISKAGIGTTVTILLPCE